VLFPSGVRGPSVGNLTNLLFNRVVSPNGEIVESNTLADKITGDDEDEI
jgi:hypothetical protein